MTKLSLSGFTKLVRSDISPSLLPCDSHVQFVPVVQPGGTPSSPFAYYLVVLTVSCLSFHIIMETSGKIFVLTYLNWHVLHLMIMLTGRTRASSSVLLSRISRKTLLERGGSHPTTARVSSSSVTFRLSDLYTRTGETGDK